MKQIKIASIILSAGLLLAGCTKSDPVATDTLESRTVYFTLDGSLIGSSGAAGSPTRATGDNTQTTSTAAQDQEKTVNSLLAVVYENDGFYKTFDVSSTGDPNNYKFAVDKDGTFDIYLVANADATLTAALKGISAGDPLSSFEQIEATQAPDADNAFLMTSPDKHTASITASVGVDLGSVHLRRLAVRIDLINSAPDITVTKITFNNRTKQSTLVTGNTMSDKAEWFEDVEYTQTLTGDESNPGKLEATIYTYENFSAKGGAYLPTLTIDYTKNGESETKQHVVKFQDALSANPADPDPLALKRNHLYRIVLQKGTTSLTHNLEVMDWESADIFTVADLPIDLTVEGAVWTEDPRQTLFYVHNVDAGRNTWSNATSGGTGTDGSISPAGWRMPTMEELILMWVYLPSINEHVTSPLGSTDYWSSTVYPSLTNNAFYLTMGNGTIASLSKSNSFNVRSVQDGVAALPGGKKYPYVDGAIIVSRENEQGVLTNSLLSDDEKAFLNGDITTNTYTEADTYNKVSPKFQVAKENCTEANTGNKGDGYGRYFYAQAYAASKTYSEEGAPAGSWRLPTQRELELIGALRQDLYPNITPLTETAYDCNYVTSTSASTSPSYRWIVSFRDSDYNAICTSKTGDPTSPPPLYVRLVRDIE